MMTLQDILPPGRNAPVPESFSPCAVYYPPMDCIIYLREDLSYRADRVDQFVTVLWHPHEDRVIGVKLKGGRYLFERVRAILSPLGHHLAEDKFLPLMSALQLAMTLEGEVIVGKAQKARDEIQRRRSERYRAAIEVVDDARFDTRELAMAS